MPLAQPLPSSNPLRQAVGTYLRLAGIETGYGFFAPNVPGEYKLVFELHFRDGHVEHELPRVNSSAGELRVAGLLDQLGRTEYEPLRMLIIKMLVHAVWREHPEATLIRAVFGQARLPTATEFEKGKRESYEFMYAYDFTLKGGQPEPLNP
ncbi:MAG: hypothetical protein ABI925_10600 [Verrucomicrobiota bacterium]